MMHVFLCTPGLNPGAGVGATFSFLPQVCDILFVFPSLPLLSVGCIIFPLCEWFGFLGFCVQFLFLLPVAFPVTSVSAQSGPGFVAVSGLRACYGACTVQRVSCGGHLCYGMHKLLHTWGGFCTGNIFCFPMLMLRVNGGSRKVILAHIYDLFASFSESLSFSFLLNVDILAPIWTLCHITKTSMCSGRDQSGK